MTTALITYVPAGHIPTDQQLRVVAKDALRPRRGRTPDEEIERGLREAGLGPEDRWTRQGRRCYARAVGLWIQMGGVPQGPRLLPREEAREVAASMDWVPLLWRGFDRRMTYAQIGAEYGLAGKTVERRANRARFALRRAGKYGHEPARGPCLGCEVLHDVEDLDADHLCAECSEGVDAEAA